MSKARALLVMLLCAISTLCVSQTNSCETVNGKGLLRSKIIQGDSAKRCTLVVRNIDNWDKPVNHVFRVSTTTYLLPGDYLIHYWMDTVWLHGEWIHISRSYTFMEKIIFEKPLPLGSVTFIKPNKVGIEKYLDY
jgi:hypothetical protein